MLFIMDNNIHETIKDIKSKFRLFMNGMVSQSMREKGMEYKLNFGIEYPRIKEIAADMSPTMNWLRHCGRKISENVRFWQVCFSRQIRFIRK